MQEVILDDNTQCRSTTCCISTNVRRGSAPGFGVSESRSLTVTAVMISRLAYLAEGQLLPTFNPHLVSSQNCLGSAPSHRLPFGLGALWLHPTWRSLETGQDSPGQSLGLTKPWLGWLS